MNLFTIAQIVHSLFNFYSTLIFIYIILTWVPMNPNGWLADIGAVLQSIVGPFLNFFRRFMPPMGGIDFSPVIAVLALNLIEQVLIGIIL